MRVFVIVCGFLWVEDFAVTLSASAAENTPQQSLEQFYKSLEKNPKTAESSITSKLSKELSEKEKKCSSLKEPTSECAGQFFYCDGDAPNSVSVENVKIKKTVATADVILCYNCKQPDEEKVRAEVKLQMQGGKWKLDSLHCVDPDDEVILKVEKFEVDKKSHVANFKIHTQNIFVKDCQDDYKLYQKDKSRFVDTNKTGIPDSVKNRKNYYLNDEFVNALDEDEECEVICRDAKEDFDIPVKVVRYEQLADKLTPKEGNSKQTKVPAFRVIPVVGKFKLDFVNFYSDTECTEKKQFSYEFEVKEKE